MADQQHQINALRKFLYSPCSITPQVWIETFLPAAVVAIFTVLTPDPKETIRILGGGKSWLKQVKVSFQDALAGEPLENYKGIRFLFEFAEGVDLAVWWLFLAGVAAEFLMDWSSMAFRMAGCDATNRSLTSERRFALGNFEGDGTWYDAGLWTEINPPTGHLLSPSVIIQANTAVAVAVTLKVKNAATNIDQGFTMRWLDNASGEVISESFLHQFDANAGNANISLDLQLTAGNSNRVITLQAMNIGGGLLTFHHGRMTIYGGTYWGIRHLPPKLTAPVE